MTDDQAPEGLDLHAAFDRMLGDEPPHRDTVALTTTRGRTALRRRRIALTAGAAGGVLAVVAVAGVAAATRPGDGANPATHGIAAAAPVKHAAVATPTSTPTVGASPRASSSPDPDARASYTYDEGEACGTSYSSACQGYFFSMDAVRPAVVAAIQVRLTDGTTKRVTTDHGSYRLEITGELPADDHWSPDGTLEHDGKPSDLFAGLTLYAADGHVLAQATSTDSDQLDPYLEICNRLSSSEAALCPN